MNKQTRMEIEHDCIALSHAFAYYIDQRKYEELAELFAPEGVWIRHGVKLQGRAQILAAMVQRPAAQFTRHVTTGFHFLEVGETSARSVAYNRSYYSFDAAVLPAPYVAAQVLVLDFLDTYTKTSGGWRFLERDTQVIMIPDEVRAMQAKSH